MARNLPPLNAVKAFEAAARHLNFSHAAAELCVTQGAVSRQIRLLEAFVGVRLFRRLARSVELTDAGSLLYPAVRGAFDELERATLKTMGGDRGGILTVSCLPTFAMKWLFPRLIDFAERWPGIEVRTVNSIRPVDFSRDDIDVAIRVGRFDTPNGAQRLPRIDLRMVEDQRGLRAVRLMSDSLVPVCSLNFLERHGPFESPDDLPTHPLIHMASRPNAWPDWLEAVGARSRPMPSKQLYGHFFLAIEAAAQGMGIALVPNVLVASELASGRLTVVIERDIESAGAYYLLCREQDWATPKVAVFRDWVVAECAAWSPPPAGGGRSSARVRSRRPADRPSASASPRRSAP